MRFEEVLNKRDPADLTEAELRFRVGSWLKIMASWKYRRDTRIEHVQQALDQLYTSLERKMKTTSSQQIMSCPLWQAMVEMIAASFPGEAERYYPTPVEQQRTLMLIRNSIATGIIKDKRRLLNEFMSHHEYHVKSLGQLAHSRLKLQLLAASSQAVLARYQASQHDSWETWFRWANRRDIGHESDSSMEIEESSLAAGKVTVRAEGGAMIGRDFEYDSRDTHGKSHWRHQIKAGGAIYAEGGAEATAGYNREQLNVAAAAGLEAEVGMRGDIEVKTEYSVKITQEAAQRVLGHNFKIIEAQAQAHSKIGSGGSASVSARAGLGGITGGEHSYEPMGDGKAKWKEVGTPGVRAGGETEIWIGFTLSGQAGLTVAQSLELGVSGDVFGGARAGCEAGFFVESGGVRFGAGAEVFAGFEAAVEEKVTIKHPKRKLEIFTVKGRQSFTAGIGAGASAEFAAGIERFSLKTESQTTLGIGSKLTTTMGISPLALGLAAYDMAIVPSLWALNQKLRSDPRLNKSSFARCMNHVVQTVDNMADVAEVRAMSRECDTVIAACVSALDQDAEWLQTLRPREAGSSYGAMPETSSVAGFTGHTQSAFYKYDQAGHKTGVDEDALTDAFSQLQVASDTHFKGADEKTLRRPVDLKLLTREVNNDTSYDWMFGKFARQDRRYGY